MAGAIINPRVLNIANRTDAFARVSASFAPAWATSRRRRRWSPYTPPAASSTDAGPSQPPDSDGARVCNRNSEPGMQSL